MIVGIAGLVGWRHGVWVCPVTFSESGYAICDDSMNAYDPMVDGLGCVNPDLRRSPSEFESRDFKNLEIMRFSKAGVSARIGIGCISRQTRTDPLGQP